MWALDHHRAVLQAQEVGATPREIWSLFWDHRGPVIDHGDVRIERELATRLLDMAGNYRNLGDRQMESPFVACWRLAALCQLASIVTYASTPA